MNSAFLRDGYAILDGFVAGDELEPVRAEERLLQMPSGPACERPHNTLVPLRWDDAVVGGVLADEHRMRRLAAAVGAADLRWISGYLSLKEPHSPPLWWHQDWWCWDHPVSYRPEAPQVALLCYLSATSDRNAALRVLPGSHHHAGALHACLPEAHADESGALPPSHPALRDDPGQVTLALAAGDAVAIDYRLLHGTHANATAARRDCLLLTFAPAWRALPPEIRGHLIQHPALPADREPTPDWAQRVLPRYDGPRGDLALNRAAPADLAIDGRLARSSMA